ncbi:MAG TPA: AsmA-like C-terminal region-containing protein, partial [Terriglobales bacterium]|nr:AsmA-like C-terminal region-containing protein [Terriglobales bacterium]
MAIRRKTIIVVTVVVAAAMISVAWLLSVLVNPDRYRPQVISYLEAKTGKQIEVGHIGVNWIPLSIRIDNFGCRNPKPFPFGYFLKAARIDAAIDAAALLHRRIVIKSIVLHDPIINVISDPDGEWNFENPPSKTSHEPIPIFAVGVISRIGITGGQLFASSLIDPADRPGPVVFEAHNLEATLKQVDLDAFVGPVSSVVAHGDMKADLLRFGAIEATNVNCKLRLLARQVFFSDVRAEAYRGTATGDLSFTLSGKNASFQTQARVRRIDMGPLLAAFRNARGKMTGIMEGDVKLAGEIEHTLRPLAGMHGTGHVTVRNGQVPSLKLN